MEKYGVSKEVLHEDLRNEEATLMQQLQNILFDGEKTATDRSRLETRLQNIRSKLSELDGVVNNPDEENKKE